MSTRAPGALAVAVYARKSTEQNGVTEENRSVTRQKELARQFAAARGWIVVAEFEDDGISGAECDNRPGLVAMRRAAAHGQFHIVIVSEQKSLTRETFGAGTVIKELAQAGIRVWSYMDQRGGDAPECPRQSDVLAALLW